jgi:phosphatidylserine decarboxylase
MSQAFWGQVLRVLPKNLVSYWVGVLVHIRLPRPFAVLSMRWFANRYRINLEEAEHPLEHYRSIGDLFTRRLKPGVRPVGDGLVHPADADVTVNEEIPESGVMIQSKNHSYSLNDFVLKEEALSFLKGGRYVTYYLCPTDYHRVHSPVSGEIVELEYIPGRLWPVNPWSVNNVDRLFAVNERVVVWIRTETGVVGMVFVGATNVGKMTMAFDPEIVTNASHRRKAFTKTYETPIAVKSGDEVGTFHMGSTIIMLYPSSVESASTIKKGTSRMGQSV